MSKHHNFSFFFQRCENCFTDGTEHSLGGQAGCSTALTSYYTTQSAILDRFPGGSTCPVREQQYNLLLNILLCNSIKSQVTGPHCIISIESAMPKVGAWELWPPAAWRVRGKVTCLRLLLRVHRFCQLQSLEPLFQQKWTLLCSHQSSRCHCRSCCLRHLQQQNHTN